MVLFPNLFPSQRKTPHRVVCKGFVVVLGRIEPKEGGRGIWNGI